MTGAPKVALTRARDIPLDKLVLSQRNVRRVQAGVSIEDLAEDIARRGLLQSLSVRPILDGDGHETGAYEVPAGGRRLQALQVLVKRKRLPKTAPVPCIVKLDGLAEEDSLAENTMREALHPLDQFRAFKAMRDGGLGEEDIAARFFVSPLVVKQRLKLATVSPKLLDVYAADGMTLEQLAAFSVSPDHERQELTWESVSRGYNRSAYYIRQLLTQDQVPADDRRARFVGVEAYEAAGGKVLRDLFEQDRGGWLTDVALLDRLAAEKLQAVAAQVVAEGWKWVDVAMSFPYGHTTGLLRLTALPEASIEEERSRIEALREEYDEIEAAHAGDGELSKDVDARLAEIEQEIDAFEARSQIFTTEVKAVGGAFVSVDQSGTVSIARGYARPEDLPPADPSRSGAGEVAGTSMTPDDRVGSANAALYGGPSTDAVEPEEEDGDRPLSERLTMELTTARTLALREALAADPDAAFVAVLHAMVLKLFYASYSLGTCLEIETRSTSPDRSVEGLTEFGPAAALLRRKEAWTGQLPRQPRELWYHLVALDGDSRADLFALCAGLSVNAMHRLHDRRPDAIAHGGCLAAFVGLDMAEHWTPTAQSYFGKVTKGRILSAVREAKGEASAQLIDHLKKADMAVEAERLVAGTGWLPQPLRTPGVEPGHAVAGPASDSSEPEALPAFLADEDALADAEIDPAPHAIAAE